MVILRKGERLSLSSGTITFWRSLQEEDTTQRPSQSPLLRPKKRVASKVTRRSCLRDQADLVPQLISKPPALTPPAEQRFWFLQVSQLDLSLP